MTTILKPVCRGYITARHVRGSHVPQRVQNLVVRDYTQRNGIEFRLSEVEYLMPGCYIMLNSVIAELPHINGVVAYSLFMMPKRLGRRLNVWKSFVDTGRTLHFAVENFSLSTATDIQTAEDILAIDETSSTSNLQF
ncbi:MAG: sporadic carbohydrate cluster protein, TIGR04323 family [Alphaproteobacteria bacterium]|jgi:sporadic carbohydrate cluster protein (TIGR04323 family)|nr:sporadic carbohydrate cluster protein, TIGR04323 family [Alphaproteobacteria bacterium]MBT4082931.1 sporadic carbohydrate cluster protein, TIGR04323 family [Alphaproteobacteria bacterium]MBT4546633.1 sporadic carbohydrate cluster protein, TIGR04323 family [Alphaproteobacteria bacterium]MBT7747057.1 sporadic carbohydrate cluster protein, TIGR04323 family [Alphaproteobacteria bacterium]